MTDSEARLDKKVREDIGDWYNSEWKSPAIKKLYEAKRTKIDEIRNIHYKKYTKKILNIVEEYDNKELASIPKYSKLQHKKYIQAKKDALAKSWREVQKDPRYIELLKKERVSYQERDNIIDKINNDYEVKMLGQILKELGYENSREARAYIYTTILWD